MAVSAVQLLNAYLPMLSRPASNLTVVSAWQFWNT